MLDLIPGFIIKFDVMKNGVILKTIVLNATTFPVYFYKRLRFEIQDFDRESKLTTGLKMFGHTYFNSDYKDLFIDLSSSDSSRIGLELVYLDNIRTPIVLAPENNNNLIEIVQISKF